MAKLSIGVIGIGSMGATHAKNLATNKVSNAKLGAVCDLSIEHLTNIKNTLGTEIQYFNQIDEFLQKANVDGVIVATPHNSHPEIGIKAIKANKHILIEKPMGTHTKHVKELNNIAAQSDRVFCTMLNQRTRPMYVKAKSIIEEGQIGVIKRVQWTITDWYRSQAYYDSNSWRGSWAGEGGGGVLLNQCPHNLDLFQWICGMPKRVRAFCSFGKYHHIEVEDDVTAYFEYENGATATFIASTGEYPGTNRLEIIADKGKIVIEGNQLDLWQNDVGEREWNKQNREIWASPKTSKTNLVFTEEATEHVGIIQNWVNAILNGEKLLAPGEEGIYNLQIANAILLSSWQDRMVDLDFDDEVYYQTLESKIKNSKKNKNN